MSRVQGYRTERERRNYIRKIRRQKEIRRNVIIAIVTAVVLAVFTFSYHTLISAASTGSEKVSYKYFTSIQVEAGDTLWSIAEEYADDEHYSSHKEYINEVKRMNKMRDDNIHYGQYLIIPYYSSEFIQ